MKRFKQMINSACFTTIVTASLLMAGSSAFATTPTVVSVAADSGANTVTVTYSVNVTDATANNLGNYLIALYNSPATNKIASALNSGNVVTLTIDPSTPLDFAGKYYNISIKGVQSVDTLTSLITTNITFWGDVTTPAPLGAFPGIETTVAKVDFDTNLGAITNEYGYTYSFAPSNDQFDNNNSFSISPTGGVGGSAFLQDNFDTSTFTNDFPNNVPLGAGSGVGVEASAGDPSVFTSTNLDQFKFYFDLKTSGLSNSVVSTPETVEIWLLGPDKENPNDFSGLQFITDVQQAGYNVTSNWQTFSMTFDDYQNNGGASFPLYTNSVYQTDPTNTWNVNYNKFVTFKAEFKSQYFSFAFDNAWGGQWDSDDNNYLQVDNVRFVRVDHSILPPLKISLSGGQGVISWTSPDKLQSATAVSGPWADVFGAVYNTYAVPVTGPTMFFRTRGPLP